MIGIDEAVAILVIRRPQAVQVGAIALGILDGHVAEIDLEARIGGQVCREDGRFVRLTQAQIELP